MIVDTIQGDPVLDIVDGTSAGKTVKFAIHNDRVEYGLIKSNTECRPIVKQEVDSKIIFEDFVSYYGKKAFEKLKDIGFKFE